MKPIKEDIRNELVKKSWASLDLSFVVSSSVQDIINEPVMAAIARVKEFQYAISD